MSFSRLRAGLAQRLPFYYGWVILAVASVPALGARSVMAVATLSVFVVPITDQFGWSRGQFSGAVSLGALFGLIVSPFAGRLVDRYGSGVILSASSAVVGLCAIGLSLISPIWSFYALYVPGRAVFSSPLELGTSTAVSNWFIRRRPMTLAYMGVVQGIGLTIFPIIAQVLIDGWGWRTAWLAMGIFTIGTGIIPVLLLMARRPEDMGLEPDPDKSGQATTGGETPGQRQPGPIRHTEFDYTVRQALATRAFWILSLFSVCGFVVQAGVSLHQVPHYISQGVPTHLAALTASSFAFGQVPGGLFWSLVARRIPLRLLLSAAAATMAVGAVGTAASSSLSSGIPMALLLGIGVGGLHLLLRLTWADYYGRLHLGAIRGLTLPAQIGGQALGPIVAGVMFDATDGYRIPFTIFGIIVAVGAVMVLTATPPGPLPLGSVSGQPSAEARHSSQIA
ncbi:MAG: MFS transporter [SAR202 cluster bacterium Io17-Chloro-G6]|nr:MAG: MFS transporter [SAR202 cluster bacterium Io17-Chloro-G6]